LSAKAILGDFHLVIRIAVAPAEARRIARDYVVKNKALPSDAKVRVSDFGKLANGSYSVLVDLTIQTKGITRYRFKMEKHGRITSFVTR
jgi:hypothetical protein